MIKQFENYIADNILNGTKTFVKSCFSENDVSSCIDDAYKKYGPDVVNISVCNCTESGGNKASYRVWITVLND